ncbi:putative zinc-binding protein [Pseudomonas sp. H11T01]|uniref:putative zinc-binding protein n=1 Tax=Pseudomonas sp. H11T01 TaxID=3402749 RepID=UPI003ACBA14C
MPDSTLPLVYSCSGCSNVAQLANTLALRLDRAGLAEMSCIVGVGGHVPALVNKARSGRRILALDGCPLQCVEGCLNQHGLHADVHLILSQHGLRKRYGEDCTEEQNDELFEEVKQLIGGGDFEEENPMVEATGTMA